MNIELKGSLFVAGKRENVSADGKTTYYSLAVVTQSGEAGNISCNEETYKVTDPMKMYDLTCVYRDGQYKGLRCIASVPVKDSFAGIDTGVAFDKDKKKEK